LIWDVVDAWPQPEGNRWDRAECLSRLRDQLKRNRPQAVIAATRKMAEDVAEVSRAPVLAIPHHGRPGAVRTKIRQDLRVIAYEGGVAYLGVWQDRLLRACRARGIDLLLNPPSLNEADVVVALREADGYAARNWKSNVKLANAQATGTPVICVPEAGYLETAGATFPLWAETEQDLSEALEHLAPRETRQAYADGLYAERITLASVAKQYRDFLEAACSPARSS
jgi:glycosyltransferase involved in cell wall biosynthesis